MRDPLRRVAVRTKLALMFVGICLLAFGVGGYVISSSAKAALESEVRQRLSLESRAYAAALDGELRTLTQRTQDFASDGHIRDLVARLLAAGAADDTEPLRRELVRHLTVNKLPLVPAFADLTILAGDGRTVVGTAATPAAHRLELPAAVSGDSAPWLSEILEPAQPDAPTLLAVATPLLSLDGVHAIGRLVAWIHPGAWVAGAVASSDLLREPSAGAVELSLVDRHGRALHVPRALLDARGSGARSEIARGGMALRIERHPVRGAAASDFAIAANGWTARLERPLDDALAAVAGLQSRFLVIGAVLSIVTLLLMFFPLHFVARPLKRMQEATRRIQGGDFGARLPVESQDEIGELAGGFNRMAAAIEEHARRQEQTAADLRAQKVELRRERDLLTAVISSMRDGLLVLDGEGRVVLGNEAGRPLAGLLGGPGAGGAVDGLPGEGAPGERGPHAHHVCHERNGTEDCARCLFDVANPPRSCVVDVGRSVFEVQATRLLPDERGRTGRVMVARDITDRVAQDERQIHQERLAVIGEVASVMAHELNNPLAAINMFAQMLEAEIPADSPLHEHVAVIRRNIASCKRAIRELLDYATDSTPELVPVDIAAVLEDVARFLRPMRERTGVGLVLDPAARPCEVTGDEVQLRQVFVNLIVNALQAMAGRGGTIRVAVRAERDAVEVDIADQGPGIAPELRDQIFKPFFTTKPRGEGTGLGLSTARRIAELHGGSLELVRTGPDGSVFRVRLRSQQPVAAPVPA